MGFKSLAHVMRIAEHVYRGKNQVYTVHNLYITFTEIYEQAYIAKSQCDCEFQEIEHLSVITDN